MTLRLSRLTSVLIADPIRIRNTLTGKERRCSAAVIEILSSLRDGGIDEETLASKLTTLSGSSVTAIRAVESLVSDGFLIIEGSSDDDREVALVEHMGWGSVTRNQLLARRSIEFLEREDEAEQFAQLSQRGAPDFTVVLGSPSPCPTITLPDLETSYTRLADLRRSGRKFDPSASVSLGQIAAMLGAALRVTQWRISPFGPIFPLRRTPSCGGLNSVGAMVWAGRVDGIERGWYDYDPINHAFRSLGDNLVDLGRMTYGQRPFATGAAVFALYHRPQLFAWKYHDPSAYDAVFAEAGGVMIAMALQAAEFHIQLTPTNAMRTADLDRLFPVDRYPERYPLFVVAAGHPDPYDNGDYAPEVLHKVLGRTDFEE